MSTFDQRGQKVTNQTNIADDQYTAGGDIVFGDKNTSIAIGEELTTLLLGVQNAAKSGDLDADTALEVEHALEGAAQEAEQQAPDKKKFFGYLDKAKTVLDKAAGISKSVTALGTALAAAYAKINGWL